MISAAGNNQKVAGLVYIAAHAPEEGERRADLVKRKENIICYYDHDLPSIEYFFGL